MVRPGQREEATEDLAARLREQVGVPLCEQPQLVERVGLRGAGPGVLLRARRECDLAVLVGGESAAHAVRVEANTDGRPTSWKMTPLRGYRSQMNAPRDEDADQKTALAWLNQKWTGSRQCPICTQSTWETSPVVESRGFTGPDMVIGPGPVVPYFYATCQNCGYMHTFNAIAAGVVAR
ncbi:hypothetical protein GCM10008944_01760 [Cytobacillus oceanisediminis]